MVMIVMMVMILPRRRTIFHDLTTITARVAGARRGRRSSSFIIYTETANCRNTMKGLGSGREAAAKATPLLSDEDDIEHSNSGNSSSSKKLTGGTSARSVLNDIERRNNKKS